MQAVARSISSQVYCRSGVSSATLLRSAGSRLAGLRTDWRCSPCLVSGKGGILAGQEGAHAFLVVAASRRRKNNHGIRLRSAGRLRPACATGAVVCGRPAARPGRCARRCGELQSPPERRRPRGSAAQATRASSAPNTRPSSRMASAARAARQRDQAAHLVERHRKTQAVDRHAETRGRAGDAQVALAGDLQSAAPRTPSIWATTGCGRGGHGRQRRRQHLAVIALRAGHVGALGGNSRMSAPAAVAALAAHDHAARSALSAASWSNTARSSPHAHGDGVEPRMGQRDPGQMAVDFQPHAAALPALMSVRPSCPLRPGACLLFLRSCLPGRPGVTAVAASPQPARLTPGDLRLALTQPRQVVIQLVQLVQVVHHQPAGLLPGPWPSVPRPSSGSMRAPLPGETRHRVQRRRSSWIAGSAPPAGSRRAAAPPAPCPRPLARQVRDPALAVVAAVALASPIAQDALHRLGVQLAQPVRETGDRRQRGEGLELGQFLQQRSTTRLSRKLPKLMPFRPGCVLEME